VHCDYVLTLDGSEQLPDCPTCGGREFVRASMFGIVAGGAESDTQHGAAAVLIEPAPPEHDAHLAAARDQIAEPGEYLVYEDGDAVRTVALTREWTRIGRSLAADVRFDDPTVSRRHALIVRHPDGVRLLDDRSLNGVFVNGARVDGKALRDGDEIIVGRYRLAFISIPAGSQALHAPAAASIG
jgi:pSer/pThr/pTyr-binding forkhead associated (FHA) protein